MKRKPPPAPPPSTPPLYDHCQICGVPKKPSTNPYCKTHEGLT